MNRAGERVKGATSARQFSGYQPASRAAGRPRPALAGARRGAASRGGCSKLWSWPRPSTAVPLIGRLFSQSWRISERLAACPEMPSNAEQADAARCYALLPERGDLITPPQPHWQAWRIEVRTEGTVRTDRQTGRISADRAAGGCSHWPAREVGTVGTEERGGKEGQNPRALVASPARPPAGAGVL